MPLTTEEIDTLARKRAGAKLGWYFHATVYVLVNLFWLATQYMGSGEGPRHLFPSLGWGLGLALHGASVFIIGKGGSLRENMVRKERERIEQQQNRS